jgi:PTS system nitrogen regulatory IIA component
MRLAELVTPAQVSVGLCPGDKREVLGELARLLASGDTRIGAAEYHRVLLERESLRTTGVGTGVAIPHGKVPGLDRMRMAVALSRGGVDFAAADSRPVHIFVALATPTSSTGGHLKTLARIARLCTSERFRARVLECESAGEAYDVIIEEDERLGAG